MSMLEVERWQRRLSSVLQPLGRPYGLVMRCREAAYRKGWLSSWRPPVPCVSVGNISWGGSGKSPLCSKLLEWSLDQGLLPALLSRGYKSFPPELPYLVEPTSPVRQSGDEPLMLARRHPGAAVIVDPSRSRASRWVVNRFKPDLLILDDAFQHLALERDVDLVVLTAEDLFRDWNRVLPAGRWREGGQALSRASAFMLHITPEELSRHREAILDRLSGFAKPIFSFFLISHGVQRVIDGSWVSAVPGEYLLVSAVGSPQRVAATAEESLGRPPREHLIYPDHHFYSESDWFRIRDRSDRLGCSAVVCTSKDGVKLEPWADNRLSALEVELDFGPSLNAPSDFPSWLAARLFRGAAAEYIRSNRSIVP